MAVVDPDVVRGHAQEYLKGWAEAADVDDAPGEREAVKYAIEEFASETFTPSVTPGSWGANIERWTKGQALGYRDTPPDDRARREEKP